VAVPTRAIAALAVAGGLGAAALVLDREPDLSRIPLRSIADLERSLEDLRQRLRIPGMSAALADDRHIVWSRGFGFADLERSQRATPDTIYHLASLTKPYAATVIFQLVDERRLSLDASVSDFGITMPRSAPVRVWHLLSHTSDDPPGTKYRYDGDVYGKLGQVVERVTGHSIAYEIAERIVRPLSLAHTAPNPRDPVRGGSFWLRMPALTPERLAESRASFDDSRLDRAAIDSQLATGYARGWGQWFWPSGLFGPMRPMGHGTSLFAGGGLAASAQDVALFSIAIDQGRLVKADTLRRAWTPIVTGNGRAMPYGLGWFVQDANGARVVWHYGHFFESSTLLVKIPQRHLTFVVLANSDGLSRWRRLGRGDVLRSPAAVLFLHWAAIRPASVSPEGEPQARSWRDNIGENALATIDERDPLCRP